MHWRSKSKDGQKQDEVEGEKTFREEKRCHIC
jgi:hypothetical protein